MENHFNQRHGFQGNIVISGPRDMSVLSPGQRFMTDLLVSSLMADGGLESALDNAIKKETQKIEDMDVGLKVLVL
jgi:hypothetical protein